MTRFLKTLFGGWIAIGLLVAILHLVLGAMPMIDLTALFLFGAWGMIAVFDAFTRPKSS